MRLYYISSILISFALHSLVIMDFSLDINSNISPEVGSSKNSFRLNMEQIEKKYSKSEKKEVANKQPKKIEEMEMRESHLSDTGAETSVAVKNKFVPDYPYKSRLFGEEGVAIIKVVIDRNSNVQDSIIVKSSGYKRLDMAAIDASKKSSFRIERDGGPDLLTHTLEFSFKLKR